jgi:hypothetical protein
MKHVSASGQRADAIKAKVAYRKAECTMANPLIASAIANIRLRRSALIRVASPAPNHAAMACAGAMHAQMA